MSIHPTAVIDRRAELDPTVEVGPHAVIEGPVRIGARTRVRALAWITGHTIIGEDCDIYPTAAIGGEPQDSHYHGERSYCRIGNGVTLREGVTVHRGTQPETTTLIGDHCYLMATSHVAHNCVLGERVTFINGAAVAGHVEIGPRAILSGGAVVHQFARIGRLAFVAANARVSNDIPPFMICHGESTIVNINLVGLRRAEYPVAALKEIRGAYRTLYRSGQTFRTAVEELAAQVQTDAGRELVAFLQSESKRGFCAGGTHHGRRHEAAPTDAE